MSKQPEALRIAGQMREVARDPWAKYWERCLHAAHELERQHALIEEMRDALAWIEKTHSMVADERRRIREVLTKAEAQG